MSFIFTFIIKRTIVRKRTFERIIKTIIICRLRTTIKEPKKVQNKFSNDFHTSFDNNSIYQQDDEHLKKDNLRSYN